MKNKFLIMALAVFAVFVLAGATNENSSAEVTENINDYTQITEKKDYPYLRGTKYKNLIKTRYKNLYETTIEPEPVVEEAVKTTVRQKTSVGAASNPGYSGSIGSYSLSNYTVAAHLTVSGTSIIDRAVWQGEKTSDYTNSSVAWAAGTAHLRSGELSQNTVIYGHNWNNCFVPFKKTGSQFESLMALTYEDVVSSNQYIYLTTNSGVHTFRIFAVGFTTNLNFYINCNNVDVSSIASTAKSISLYDFGVSVGSSDKIITLSTCTRYYSGLGANQRFIVMGVLVD